MDPHIKNERFQLIMGSTDSNISDNLTGDSVSAQAGVNFALKVKIGVKRIHTCYNFEAASTKSSNERYRE